MRGAGHADASDGNGAEFLAHALRQVFERLQIPHRGNEAGWVTVSIGVASPEWTVGSQTAEVLVECADRALYRATASGRNRVCLHRAAPAAPSATTAPERGRRSALPALRGQRLSAMREQVVVRPGLAGPVMRQ